MDTQTSLATVDGTEEDALPIDEGRHEPTEVASTGRFDPVDGGAEALEVPGARRSGEQSREIEDADACQQVHASPIEGS